MKYKERDELAAGLRELADFVEDHGLDLPELTLRATCYVMEYEPKTYKKNPERILPVMRKATRAMGKASKVHDSTSFRLRREFGPIELSISTSRENVCEKRVVGFKDVPEQVISARRVEIVEWECLDSILA